jgi:hypothetical protein
MYWLLSRAEMLAGTLKSPMGKRGSVVTTILLEHGTSDA